MFLSYKGFLTKDTVLYITKYLEPQDIAVIFKAWRIGWKYFVPLYENAIKRKIDSWFRDYFGPRYERFRTCMIEDRAVISGSFVLQNILGETWKNSDIDIYMGKAKRICKTAEDWFRGIEEFLFFTKGMAHQGFTVCPRYDKVIGFENLFEIRDYTIDNDFAKMSCELDNSMRDLFGGNTEYGKAVRSYVNHRNYSEPEYVGPLSFTQFQVIELKKNAEIREIVDFINEIFDFDICKNCFYYDENGCHIILGNIDNLISKTTEFKYARAADSSASRYLKYKERGISFTNEDRALAILQTELI